MGSVAELLSPDTVAVVGATDREGAVGRTIFERLRSSFDGAVVPVNPNREQLFGVRCHPPARGSPDRYRSTLNGTERYRRGIERQRK